MEMNSEIKKQALSWFWKELSLSERDKYAEQDLLDPLTESRFITEDEIVELYKQHKMTQEWIEQFNKKCAEFLFPELVDIDDTGIWGINTDFIKSAHSKYEILLNKRWSNIFMPVDLKFHSDWNWIMEVCIEINSLYGDNIFNGRFNRRIFEFKHSMFWELLDDKNKFLLKIDQFIDWYNKQKQS